MPILDPHSLEFISRSAEQTRRAGMRLGGLLQPGDVVGLEGDLGAGKTTLVQGIAAGWGSLDRVTSPTFVLVNVYRRQDRAQSRRERRLYHLDAYRLNSEAEAIDLDMDALIENGPLVVEWADRISNVLPQERLWIAMHWVDTNQRDMMISARGRRFERMLIEFRRKVFGVA
ncbi:MAG: tRNA (adenosine(37)-N6)-threonylcarbamoyltransferase complex ATPase subunit type 1 TsaE [Anaerolineales bacterium]|jgi:tRNA threonylcarbamoyladenosine biosynthesis protein TsaE